MKVKIEFNIDNDAYSGPYLAEGIVYTLEHLIKRLHGQERAYLLGCGSESHLRDSDGNRVGNFYVIGVEEEVETETTEQLED